MTTAALAPVPVRTTPLPSGLAGATVVLVGGSSGIGLAAGLLLGEIGARVVLVGRDQNRLDGAVAQVRAASADGGDAVFGVSADGADERALGEIFDRAGQVDHVLVTTGGIGGAGSLAEVSLETIRSSYDERVGGAFAAARVAATRLPAGGSITLTSGSYVVRPVPGIAGPLTAVGAVETLTKALAVELAPQRLRVNTVRYGSFDTPLMRRLSGISTDEAIAQAGASSLLGRFGTAAEAAASALFLMANNYVTGQIITVDGGQGLA